MDVARDGEWMTAFVKHVPTRKGYIRRDENENESEQPASKKRKNETNNTNNNSHKEDENMTSIK
jgi:Sec-independent protein translocase protein TatA